MKVGLSHGKLRPRLVQDNIRSFIEYLHSSAKIPFMSPVKIYDSSASKKGNEKNRRANARYALNKVMEYRTVGSDTDWRFGRAFNMSGRGILVEVPEHLPVGSSLEISMDWTGLYHGVEKMTLLLTGTVVRLDGSRTTLRITGHKFHHVDPILNSGRPTPYVHNSEVVSSTA